jgi:predicted homoserine dehydrogenase-like protein
LRIRRRIAVRFADSSITAFMKRPQAGKDRPMNYHAYYAGAERPIETCIVGTGGFGQSFLAQTQRVPLMNARIAVDLDAEHAAAGLKAAGFEPRRIRICRSGAEAKAAWDAGDAIAAGDLSLVAELPFDVVVEATGRPMAAARHAQLAIDAGKHLALVTKELDSVAGAGLARQAAMKGRVSTTVDGDQPSLLIGLATWAETLGFEIVAAGKSSEYDFVFDPASGRLASNETAGACPDLAAFWEMGQRDVAEVVAGRARVAAAFPQRAVPDLCELLVVGNATGLVPDRPDFHAPLLRIPEVPTAFTTAEDGGLLSGERRLDVFHCLRKPDDISFAGGVFVVVRCRDAASWEMLAQKGHILSRTRNTAMLFLPRHLLGLEAATSILDAAIHGVSGYGGDYRPRLDLVAVATQDLSAGTQLTMGGHHHTISGVTATLQEASRLGPETAAPFYLAADNRLNRPVRSGEVIRMGDLDMDPQNPLSKLRRMQDDLFFGDASDRGASSLSDLASRGRIPRAGRNKS